MPATVVADDCCGLLLLANRDKSLRAQREALQRLYNAQQMEQHYQAYQEQQHVSRLPSPLPPLSSSSAHCSLCLSASSFLRLSSGCRATIDEAVPALLDGA